MSEMPHSNARLFSLALVAFLLVAATLFLFRKDLAYTVEYDLLNKDYVSWKRSGGELIDGYLVLLESDWKRDRIIEGKNIKEVLGLFQGLVDFDSLGDGDHRQVYVSSMRVTEYERSGKRLKVFLLSPKTTWAFIFVDDVGFRVASLRE